MLVKAFAAALIISPNTNRAPFNLEKNPPNPSSLPILPPSSPIPLPNSLNGSINAPNINPAKTALIAVRIIVAKIALSLLPPNSFPR